MQTKPKANSIIAHLLDTLLGRPIITFKFRGEDIGRLDIGKMSPECKERAMIHGMLQRIGDGGAVERMDKATGLIRTDAEMDDIKKVRITSLIEHYNSGTAEWNLVRSGGGGVDTSGLTIEAISRVYGWSVSDTERKVDTLAEKKGIERKEMLRTYANIPDVAAMIGSIKAERAARTGISATDLTNELMSA